MKKRQVKISGQAGLVGWEVRARPEGSGAFLTEYEGRHSTETHMTAAEARALGSALLRAATMAWET